MPRQPRQRKESRPSSGRASSSRPPEAADAPEAIRNLYAEHGVAGCYERRGATYRNPFEAAQRELLVLAAERFALDLGDVLDLACGSGEATLALRDLTDESADRAPSPAALAPTAPAPTTEARSARRFTGVDPFTGAAYRERTGLDALPLSFEQIADGALEAALPGRRFTLIVCACALHLCEASRLPVLLWRLREAAEALLVVTPNKRPEIRAEWGWRMEGEILHRRLRARFYRREG